MNTKEDFANALGTLLCLDRVMISNLEILKIETLAKMYNNYIQNAKDSNNKLEVLMGAVSQSRFKRKRTHQDKLKEIYGRAN